MTDKEQIRQAAKLTWMRAIRDVYRKFTHTQQQSLNIGGVNMPFFYVKNNNFCALFMRDQEGSPIVKLIPSKTIAHTVNSNSIQKVVQNICHDEQEQEDEERKKREEL
jgi:hypothetical protein